MNYLKTFIAGISLLMFISSPFAQDDHAGHDHSKHGEGEHMQKLCPVMGNPISEKLFVDKGDERIFICCEACRDEVKKNFKKYAGMLKEQGVYLDEHKYKNEEGHSEHDGHDHGKKKLKKKHGSETHDE